MLHTDAAWEKFGRDDPYFGVLAEDKFSRENIERNRGEFFSSGAGAAREIIERCEKHFGPLGRGRILDHGCGVGRLTFALAREFESVVAVDVSPSMLAEAAANAERFGAQNVTFAPVDATLSNASGEFDFVNSYMVLQHVPVRRGLRILGALLDKVRAGGGFHLHLSIRTDRLSSRALWWASHHIPGVKLWQNLCAGRRWNAPAMQMNNYPLNRMVELMSSRGATSFLVATEKHAEFLTISLFGKMPEPL
jgi:SAM-dependent methyltransferase